MKNIKVLLHLYAVMHYGDAEVLYDHHGEITSL